jgi:mono/diheme cytochrome c family protein
MRTRYLAAVIGMLAVAGASRAAAQAPDGQALYRRECRSCHGANGVPPQRAREQYERIPTLSDSAFMARRTDDSIVAVLRRGLGRDMKSFSDKLTAEEMRAVVLYVRTLARRRSGS